MVLLIAVPLVYVAATFVEVLVISRRDQRADADALVVLGAAQYDGRPSGVLKSRLDHAFELWEEGVAPAIVLTGAKQAGDRFTEAFAGFQYLREKGVPEDDLVIVDDGTDTWESLTASARQLPDAVRGDDPTEIVMVSDAYHSARLLGIAEELGLEAEVSPASTGVSPAQLAKETALVSVGRLIGYRRVTRLTR